MRKLLLLAALCGMANCIYAQKDTLVEKEMNEAMVYSSKFREKRINLFQKIDVLTARTIARYNGQNTGDLLLNTGNVFVQKSQQGGSSPVIRGFEASRVLIVVDGIRLNNAIYRAGHLQNVITIDQNMLERAEILYGPSSTLYGSDALGGVVHLQTKSPRTSGNKKLYTTGSAFTRYSTVNDERTLHADLNLGGKKIAWLQSLTFSDFGDLKMGSHYPDKYPTFGRRDSMIAIFGNIDSVVANKDKQVQKFSGYKQWDWLEKILFKQNDKITHLINFQFSTTNNVPRYDRLQDKRNFGGSIGTTLRFANWYYGPQERWLAAYEFNAKSKGFFNEVKAIFNYQDVNESRQQREFRGYDRFDSRKENVKVAGFVIDGRKKFGNNEITIGTDGQLNTVRSKASRTNLTTGAVSKLDTRYPDGKNKMNYFSVYAQHLLKMKGGKWVLNDGIRLQSVSLQSQVLNNSFFNLPVTNFEQRNFSLTGNLGLIYMPQEKTRITLGCSSGFRAPNLDDLVKIFDFSVAKRVYVPNADIDPEYTYNFDLGIHQQFNKIIKFDLTGFYTFFNNAIVSAPFKLNGEDSIVYNSVKSAVYANQNLNKARTYGFSSSVSIEINKKLNFQTTASYTRGRLDKFGGSEIPQDHIPPFFGKTSLSYENMKFGMELFSLYNGWKKIKDYNPDGEDNQQYATADGMPSWMTMNWRGNIKLGKAVRLQLAIENIFNRNYRYFASGFSAPGRNFIMALRTNW